VPNRGTSRENRREQWRQSPKAGIRFGAIHGWPAVEDLRRMPAPGLAPFFVGSAAESLRVTRIARSSHHHARV